MRVLIDSNVLFSAIYQKSSVPHQAYSKAVESPYQCLICDESIEELRDAYEMKLPHLIAEMEDFIAAAKLVVELVPVPEVFLQEEKFIRDPDDAMIIRAAIAANADILISGDKDFLESGIMHPRIITAAQFVQNDF